MNHKEALQKILELEITDSSSMGDFIESAISVLWQVKQLATEALQSESMMYSEKEVCGFAEWCIENDYKWHQHFDNPNGGSGVWYHIDDYENTEPITSKELFQKFLQSLQPKTEELKEGLKPCPNHPDVLTSQCGICNGDFPKLEQPKTEEQTYGEWMRSNPEQPTSPLGGKYEAMNNAYKKINSPSMNNTLPIPCNNFEGSYATSSATKCKWCGLEEWQHKEFKKLSILPESSNPIATDHTPLNTSLSIEKMAEEFYIDFGQANMKMTITCGEIRKYRIDAFIEGYKVNNHLDELEKVKKIEDWLREYPIDGGVIFVKDLLEYIQLIKH